MRALLLVGWLFLPAMFDGSSASLWKAAALLVLTLALETRQHWSDYGKTFLVGCAVATLAAFSSLLSPFCPLLEGFCGRPETVAGWFTMLGIFLFAWMGYWKWTVGSDYSLFADEDHPFTLHAFAMIAVALTATSLFCWDHWKSIDSCFASRTGAGFILALIPPYLLAYGLRETRKPLRWTAFLTLFAALVLVVDSGLRSGLLGCLIGCGVTLALWSPLHRSLKRGIRSRIKALFWVLGAAFAVVLISPTMADRLCSVNPLKMGHGPRAQMTGQLLSHGVTTLGWGIESQHYLIDRSEGNGFEQAPDPVRRPIDAWFHFWPADVVATVGIIGLALVCCALFFIFQAVLDDDGMAWWRNGFAGVLVAFLVTACWTPPYMSAMLLAAIATSGLFVRPPLPAPVYSHRRSSPSHPLLRATGYVAGFAAVTTGLIVLGTLLVADIVNERSKRQWAAGVDFPHAILGRMRQASIANPWTENDWIRVFYFAQIQKVMTEDPARLMRYLLRKDQRDYRAEAMVWASMGDQWTWMCAKALRSAIMDCHRPPTDQEAALLEKYCSVDKTAVHSPLLLERKTACR